VISINVTDKIVKNNLCIGCGICAATCPTEALEIKFNEYGEYNSVLTGTCLESCSLCLEVCPFNDNKNEDQLAESKFFDGMTYQDNLGYYINTYSGHVNDDEFRLSSASGGLTTWILEKLLSENLVDYVINVRSNNDSEKLFKFQIADNVEDVRNGASSAYYPVEMSEVIKKIIQQKGRYVVVGLPCFLKAIEIAKEKNGKLKDRITYTVGLTCGQLKNKKFTDYIAKKANFNCEINKVNFRKNSSDEPANNYYYYFTNNNNNKNEKIYWREGINKVWTNRWFTYNSCSYCDDTFAELADVTLMDAWLPEFKSDYKGNNLLVVRNKKINDLLLEKKNYGEIKLNNIESDRVIKSQQGVIDIKRKKLAYRLYLAEGKEAFVPDKRVKASTNIDFFSKKEVDYKDEMQELSKSLWGKFKSENISINKFELELNKKMKSLNNWFKIKRILDLPKRILRKFYNIIN
jgi:coenzyme F420-reducing hydrogenase beta subunit